MTLDFDTNKERLFNPLYYKLRNVPTRFCVNFGGAGSGKSVAEHQLDLINLFSAKSDTLYIRKHAADLHDSCYSLFQSIASGWGISKQFKWNFSNSKRQIYNYNSGKRILLKGIDDPEKLKSIVGIGKIVVEEASQLTWEDFLELNRRARGIEGIRIILLLNPISEKHWIKKKLIDGQAYKDRVTIIKSTHLDNKFLTDDDHAELEALKLVDYNQYRIYALGEWGIEDKSNKFAYAFDREKHCTLGINALKTRKEVLYLSFDFNRNPITAGAIQYVGGQIRVLRSFKLANSNIYALCDLILAEFPNYLYQVTGDATGANKSALTKDAINYYTVIKEKLNLFRVDAPRVNPPIDQNRLLVNAILHSGNVIIDEEHGADLIYDLEYVEVDEKNKIVKDRTSAKKEADHLDWFRYYLNTYHRRDLKTPQALKDGLRKINKEETGSAEKVSNSDLDIALHELRLGRIPETTIDRYNAGLRDSLVVKSKEFERNGDSKLAEFTMLAVRQLDEFYL